MRTALVRILFKYNPVPSPYVRPELTSKAGEGLGRGALVLVHPASSTWRSGAAAIIAAAVVTTAGVTTATVATGCRGFVSIVDTQYLVTLDDILALDADAHRFEKFAELGLTYSTDREINASLRCEVAGIFKCKLSRG